MFFSLSPFPLCKTNQSINKKIAGQKYPRGAKKKILNTNENIIYLICFKCTGLDFSKIF